MRQSEQIAPTSVAGPRARHRKWSGSIPGSIEALQVVYKVAERCNINCSYCYYFHMGDHTPLERPAYASAKVTAQLARWMADGCAELEIPRAKLAFHGGEPTMIGLAAFNEACRILRDTIEPVVPLSLAIQTNGTLLDDRWIETFAQHRVGVGVSIDGDQAANDRFRLDRKGRSTFAKTEGAIKQLVALHAHGAPRPSTIAVLDKHNDYRAIYAYLRELGVQELNFLLPDRSADDQAFVESGEAQDYGRCLAEIFEAWLAEDNPDVRIKFIDQAMGHFRSGIIPGAVYRKPRKSNQVVIARSDGTVSIDDSYTPALSWYQHAPVYSVRSHSLRTFLGEPIFSDIEDIARTLPTECQSCTWRYACRGGDLENRFSSENGFDNPSVYCGAYKVMYEEMGRLLVSNGYPPSLIEANFGGLQ